MKTEKVTTETRLEFNGRRFVWTLAPGVKYADLPGSYLSVSYVAESIWTGSEWSGESRDSRQINESVPDPLWTALAEMDTTEVYGQLSAALQKG